MDKLPQILYKLRTCTCGCGGRDPWHRSSYRRHVTQTSDTTGTVRLPFSTQPVQVTRDNYSRDPAKPCYGAWVVVYDSIIFDK